FIGADKPSTPNYFQWAVRHAHRGSLIVVDNVVREGAIIEESSDDPNGVGMRRFFELASADPRVSGTAIQTVGSKGHDGLAILLSPPILKAAKIAAVPGCPAPRASNR